MSKMLTMISLNDSYTKRIWQLPNRELVNYWWTNNKHLGRKNWIEAIASRLTSKISLHHRIVEKNKISITSSTQTCSPVSSMVRPWVKYRAKKVGSRNQIFSKLVLIPIVAAEAAATAAILGPQISILSKGNWLRPCPQSSEIGGIIRSKKRLRMTVSFWMWQLKVRPVVKASYQWMMKRELRSCQILRHFRHRRRAQRGDK